MKCATVIKASPNVLYFTIVIQEFSSVNIQFWIIEMYSCGEKDVKVFRVCRSRARRRVSSSGYEDRGGWSPSGHIGGNQPQIYAQPGRRSFLHSNHDNVFARIRHAPSSHSSSIQFHFSQFFHFLISPPQHLLVSLFLLLTLSF